MAGLDTPRGYIRRTEFLKDRPGPAGPPYSDSHPLSPEHHRRALAVRTNVRTTNNDVGGIVLRLGVILNRLIPTGVALIALVAGPAMAADLAVKAPAYKAPPPVAVFSWTGAI